MRTFAGLIIIFAFITGCENKEKKEDILFKEVMDIHDEAMVEMSAIRRLAKSLEARVDSIRNNVQEYDSLALQEMVDATQALRDANKSMTDWMYEFKQVDEDTPQDSAILYLNDQKVLISNVREEMFSAKARGEKLLNQ